MTLTDNQAKVRDALPGPGQESATAGTLAETTGLAYSTVTRLLRELAAAGEATKDTTGWQRTAEPTTAGIERAAADQPEDDANGPDPNTATEASEMGEEPTHPRQLDDPAEDSADDDDPADTADESRQRADEATDATADDGTPPEPGAQVEAPATKRRRRAGETTTSSKQRLPKGALREQVLAVLREAGEPLGPSAIAKRLDGKSQGAIANACDKLVEDGLAQLVEEKPRRFAATR